ncbi:MAG: galactokinase [Clostridiales bacterium]|nr:galactokinase [Clostridiales bacterium]
MHEGVTHEGMRDKTTAVFGKAFGDTDGIRVFFAPGRINLIGEHTDYNGGCVLPCALEMGTYCALRPGEGRAVRMYSGNFPGTGVIEWDLDRLAYREDAGWSNYPAGVVWALSGKGLAPRQGFDIAFLGDIPTSAGLSSSASIEVVTGYALATLNGWDIPMAELALTGQDAENNFVGMGCGIMDQFSISLGRAGHAIFLDTSDLSYEYVPLALGDYCIMIMNTCKQRSLTDSKYNERRAECGRALSCLAQAAGVKNLCDLDEEGFEAYKHLIKGEEELKRARHVVYENGRAIKAKGLLAEGDFAKFGLLLDQSHLSLERDYEVTGVELDTLAGAAREQKGVLGARMTGAGFGGCAICIVEKGRAHEAMHNIGEAYYRKTGYRPEFYITDAGGGPVEL